MSDDVICTTEKLCNTTEAWGLWGLTILLTLLSMKFMHKIPRSRGRAPAFVSRAAGNTGGAIVAFIFHAAYVVGVVLVLQLLPTIAPGLDKALFSQEGVIVIGFSQSRCFHCCVLTSIVAIAPHRFVQRQLSRALISSTVTSPTMQKKYLHLRNAGLSCRCGSRSALLSLIKQQMTQSGCNTGW